MKLAEKNPERTAKNIEVELECNQAGESSQKKNTKKVITVILNIIEDFLKNV